MELLLSWGAEEKRHEAIADVPADDIPSREPDSPQPKSERDESGGVGKTWKKPRLGSVMVVLAICVLAMGLFWHGGIFPMPAKTVWS